MIVPTTSMQPPPSKIHFQSQSLTSRSCGVHVVNNLLGKRVYTTQQFNKICSQLSSDFINPYKSIFGGDFDVTTIITALKRNNLETRWLKNSQSLANVLENKDVVGFLINKKISNGFINRILQQSGRHWRCIRKIGQKYILLDSLQKDYRVITQQIDVQGYLQIAKEKGETILVVQQSKQKQQQIQQI